MKLKSILCILLLSLCAATAGFSQKKVAVYVTGECDAGVSKVLTDRLCAAFTDGNGDYKAIERMDGFLAAISKELKYQRTGTVQDSLITKLGKQFGAQYVCVAEITKVFGENYIAARLVNTETSLIEIQASHASKLSNMAELIAACDSLKAGLTKSSPSNSKSSSSGNAASNKPTSTTNSQVAQSGFVDLGLSVKWAACNLGATKPEQYGDYYAWGETSMKVHTKDNCKAYGMTLAQLQSSGRIDALGNLTRNYDVARCKGVGRMPTLTEIHELKNRCKWKWTSQNGENGYKVTGPNGNSIFLPAAGYRFGSNGFYVGSYGYYWSSSAFDGCKGYDAFNLYFESGRYYWSDNSRCYGYSVRPVMDK